MQTRPLELAWRDAIQALLPAPLRTQANGQPVNIRAAGEGTELLPPAIIAEVRATENRGANGRLARAELDLVVRTQVDDETAAVHAARFDGLAALLAPAGDPRVNTALLEAMNGVITPLVQVLGYSVAAAGHETDQEQREWRSTLTLWVGYQSLQV